MSRGIANLLLVNFVGILVYHTVAYDMQCFYYVRAKYKISGQSSTDRNLEPRMVPGPRTKNGTELRTKNGTELRTKNSIRTKNQEWYQN